MKLKLVVIGFSIALFVLFCRLDAQNFDTVKVYGKVVHMTLEDAYFNFGERDGVEVGDSVIIFRGDKKLAALKIASVGSKTSSARISAVIAEDVKPGDSVIVIKIGSGQVTKSVKVPSDTVRFERDKLMPGVKAEKFSVMGLKEERFKFYGRLAFQNYYSKSDNGFGFQRPGVLMVLNADRFYWRNLKLNIYARFDENMSVVRDKLTRDSKLSVYQFSAEYAIGNFLISLGRIFPYASPGAGEIDGIKISFGDNVSNFGVIYGSRASQSNLNYKYKNSKVVFYGLKTLRGEKIYINSSVSYIRSYFNSKIDEEFISFQGFLNFQRFASFSITSQLDLNDVKSGARVRKLMLRNFFSSLSFYLARWLNIGLDMNFYRNAYLFETMRNIPDILFDRRIRRDFGGRFNIYLPLNGTLGTSFMTRLNDKSSSADYFLSNFLSFYNFLQTGFDIRTGYNYSKTKFASIRNFNFGLGRAFLDEVLYLDEDIEVYNYFTTTGSKYSSVSFRFGIMLSFLHRFNLNFSFERNKERGFARTTVFTEFGIKF